MTLLNEQIRKTQLRKGSYYYFLPTYRQAKQVVWDELIEKHVPSQLIEKVNDSELAVYWKNGSIQRFVGCEDIDKHRGINPIDVVFDEFSEMKEQIWTAIIQPILRENNGTASFGFTPKGQNHAWRLVQRAKDDPDDWYVISRNVYQTSAFTPEAIEDAKRETPQSLFAQEYECEFLEGAGQFFTRVDQNLWEPTEPELSHIWQLGVDLAKYQDWTVLTPFDLNTFRVHTQDRFNQVDWNLQKARIEALARKLNNAKVKPDGTGVGDPIVEDLQRAGLSVDPFKFTEISRRQLLDHLSILIQQDRIKIPNDEGLIDELKSMTFTLGETGRVKVGVPEGMTDDRIMSLALAVHGVDYAIGLPKKNKEEEYQIYSTTYT